MERSIVWRELYRTNDPALAHTVATCIEGMEFDVRVRDALGRVIDGTREQESDATTPAAADLRQASLKPPFAIDVDENEWDELREVLQELIAEQTEFDRKLEVARLRSARVAQLIILSVMTVAAAIAGASALKQCEADRP